MTPGESLHKLTIKARIACRYADAVSVPGCVSGPSACQDHLAQGQHDGFIRDPPDHPMDGGQQSSPPRSERKQDTGRPGYRLLGRSHRRLYRRWGSDRALHVEQPLPISVRLGHPVSYQPGRHHNTYRPERESLASSAAGRPFLDTRQGEVTIPRRDPLSNGRTAVGRRGGPRSRASEGYRRDGGG
jgi:hypothetical protein